MAFLLVWCDQDYVYPHSLTIDTKQLQTVKGFLIIQRNRTRKVQNLEMQVSNDNITWRSLGEFNLANSSFPQHLSLDSVESFRYFKMIAESAIDGQQYAAMAELGLY